MASAKLSHRLTEFGVMLYSFERDAFEKEGYTFSETPTSVTIFDEDSQVVGETRVSEGNIYDVEVHATQWRGAMRKRYNCETDQWLSHPQV